MEQTRRGSWTRRRLTAAAMAGVMSFGGTACGVVLEAPPSSSSTGTQAEHGEAAGTTYTTADILGRLATLEVKGRAPKTGYTREQFGDGWTELGNCDTRDRILIRDLHDEVVAQPSCEVQSGILDDPYTGKRISFVKGPKTSEAIQIDHVVPLSNAWQTGAQQMSKARRIEFANDPLNLLAVDGPTNNKKGDGDAATWLPPRRDEWCEYVARQVLVKDKYDELWVTPPEHAAMERVLDSCVGQMITVK